MHHVEINVISILISALIVLLLAFCILYILAHYNKRQRFFEQEVELLKLNYEKELLKAQLEIQEQTFQHISLELHDNVGHFISLAKLHLLTLTEQDENFTQKISSSVDLLGTSLQEIRLLCSNLNTSNLQNNGLINIVEQHVQQLTRSGKYEVKFDVCGETVYMDERKELILYRIIQEAINNIIKHAQATEILISLNYLQQSMELTVGDNGNGFDVDGFLKNKTSRSSGIQNIINRSSMINAWQKIISVQGKGTTLKIVTPYA